MISIQGSGVVGGRGTALYKRTCICCSRAVNLFGLISTQVVVKCAGDNQRKHDRQKDEIKAARTETNGEEIVSRDFICTAFKSAFIQSRAFCRRGTDIRLVCKKGTKLLSQSD